MNSPGDELLARPTLSVDKDRCVGWSCLEDFLPELLHQRVVADELIFLFGLFPQVKAFPFELFLVERIADGQQDSVPVEGLF
ncbi:MAG: hypothetical protein ACUVV5_01130 [Candidatus Aminicenantales bacterium]